MVDGYYIVTILQDAVFTLILLLVFIYSTIILFVRRLRNINNIFILNICLTISSTSIYFIIYFTMLYFDLPRLYAPNMCIVLLYAYNIASIAIPFSFVTFSIHRFCSIIYHRNHFFQTKSWIGLCITGQWISQCIISLPFIFRKGSFCNNELWMRIYTFIMASCVPLLLNIILNIGIFIYAHSSTRRIQPQTIDRNINLNINQPVRVSRREILLLRQMIFTFMMFIIGWTPVYLIVIINQYIIFDPLIFRYSVVIAELSVVAMVINLFICNHELKRYLINKILQFLQ